MLANVTYENIINQLILLFVPIKYQKIYNYITKLSSGTFNSLDNSIAFFSISDGFSKN